MANKILIVQGTQIVCADAATYGNSPIADTDQLNLSGVLTDEAREGNKVDLTTLKARQYAVTMRIEFATAPVVGESVDLYWGASLSGTAATANPGELTGVDADYTGSTGSTLAQTLSQLQFLGSLLVTADATTLVQQQTFVVELPLRFGIPVVHNNTSDTLDDAVEMSITFTPLEDEIQ